MTRIVLANALVKDHAGSEGRLLSASDDTSRLYAITTICGGLELIIHLVVGSNPCVVDEYHFVNHRGSNWPANTPQSPPIAKGPDGYSDTFRSC